MKKSCSNMKETSWKMKEKSWNKKLNLRKKLLKAHCIGKGTLGILRCPSNQQRRFDAVTAAVNKMIESLRL